MYPKSFVGNEAVDWLIKNISVKDRPTATLMLNILQSHNVIHHGNYSFYTSQFKIFVVVMIALHHKTGRQLQGDGYT